VTNAADDPAILVQQYGDGSRLAARQALWRYRSGSALTPTALDLADLMGTELIVDVGCGRGTYLAELRRRGHIGPLVGLDLSRGMARISGSYAPTAVADVRALPLRPGVADVVLCMHMLYHVPDAPSAIRELRRVLAPGGTVLVATNSVGHNEEARTVLTRAAEEVSGGPVRRVWDTSRFSTDVARAALATEFDEVRVHDLTDSFPVPDAGAVMGYLASTPPETVGLREGPLWTAALALAAERVQAVVASHGSFPVTSRAAVLIAR
jgi:SAM-dependent methyltransferase